MVIALIEAGIVLLFVLVLYYVVFSYYTKATLKDKLDRINQTKRNFKIIKPELENKKSNKEKSDAIKYF